MKAAVVNPYLDTLGGGELYTISFAKALVEEGYSVEIQWKEKSIKKRLEARFDLKLDGIEVVEDVKRGDGYEVCFWVSDGSVPALKARNNFLHFQVPFTDVGGKSLLNKMKLFRVKRVICNSHFTKRFIDEEYGVDSLVIYPPVFVKRIKSKRKKNQIVFVGRFSQLKQKKGQDVLIKAFKKLYDEGYEDWKLILAGGTEVGVDDYLERLKNLAKEYPVEFLESPKVDEIRKLYGESKIFWSAAGFGVDEEKEPEKMEHFGITVVEAMSGGAVPFVYKGGGHKEIVANGENGFLWTEMDEFLEKTTKLVDGGSKLRELSKNAKETSKIYEYERFKKEVRNLI